MPKVIICSLVFILLGSLIAPDFANAMGSSTISDEEALIAVGVVAVAAFIIYYYAKRNDNQALNKDTEQTAKKVQKNISESGGLIVFKW